MKNNSESELKKIPCRVPVDFKVAGDGLVTLFMEHKGLFDKIAQKLFKKPRVSQIHLEEFGSFIWQCVDGKKSVEEIGGLLREKFGQKAEPVYPRLVQYLRILKSNGFISIC